MPSIVFFDTETDRNGKKLYDMGGSEMAGSFTMLRLSVLLCSSRGQNLFVGITFFSMMKIRPLCACHREHPARKGH